MPKRPKYTGELNLGAARPSEVTSLRQGANLAEYEKLLTDSWNLRESGQNHTMEVPIPAEARTTVESRLRQAAKAMDVGVATGVREDQSLPAGHVWLMIQANPKKARPSAEEAAAKKAEKATKATAKSKGLPPVAAAS